MASLSYHSEHMAWQQRVQKEAVEASRFHRTMDGFFPKAPSSPLNPSNPNHLRDEPFHHSPAKHSTVRVSVGELPMSPYRSRRLVRDMVTTKNSIGYFGPVEVRGKYARPAGNVDSPKGSAENTETGFQGRTGSQPPLEEGRSPKSRKDVRVRASRLSASPHARVRLRNDLDLLGSMQKVAIGDPESCAEGGKQPAITEEQLKYIEELEAKLKEERKKRMEAEARLNALSLPS